MKSILKRGLALLLAVTITSSSFSGLSLKAEAQTKTVSGNTLSGNTISGNAISNKFIVEIDTSYFPDTEELYAGYLENLFYSDLYGEISTFANVGESRLTETEKEAYAALQKAIEDIAAGKRDSTEISLSENVSLTWTTEELGVVGVTAENFEILVKAKMKETLDTFLAYLLMDCSYDLYWYDKTDVSSVGFDASYTSTDITVNNIILRMPVAVEFQCGDTYIFDINQAANAVKAKENAQEIASKYGSGTPYEKMLGFKNEICGLVSYNDSVLDTNEDTPYGNPWQMLWVFDKDESTKVVCEGYSKAFQYLCDLAGLTCYTVTGTMDGGAHMWNIVTLDGENYLVDVTNCDTGTIGADEKLFLAGASGGTYDTEYTFDISEDTVVTYVYDGSQIELLGKEILTLANTSYDPEAESKILDAVTLQAKATSCREITLSWSENERADGYIVYQVGNAGEKKEIFRSSSVETLTYKVTKLAPGTKYSYLVVPYREIEGVVYEGLESQIVSVKTATLPKVTLTAKTVDYSQIKLTWTKNQYADGYYIYRKNGSSSTKIATISKNTILTYTVAKLAPNTSYTYYVVPYCTVSAKNYTGAASVTVSAKTKALTAVTLKATSVNYNQIKLTWSKNKDANGYYIYRKTSGGKYSLIKTITAGSTVTYTDTKLAFNTAYAYIVAPIIKLNGVTYKGTQSSAVSAKTTLATPKISAVKNVNYKTLQIAWGKISGASGYEIYRSNSSGSGYKLVKRIASGGTVSYKDTTVTPNTTHYYRVRAYRTVNGKRVYGSFSTVNKGKSMFTQVTGVKVKAKDYTTLNLSWNKVSGATKYQIYYSTSKNSGYKGLATVTSNSYSWKKPNCGTTYYFMIRAVKVEKGKNIYGTYCTAASGKTTIGKPTVSAAKKNYSSITVSWKKVAGAQKYDVYWATSKNGTYKKLSTVTGTSYTHTGRTLGTTYYYKVRAIRQKSTSAFSSVVSAKTSLGKITELKTGKYGSDGFKISWKAADGATSYKVYRSTLKLSGYKEVGTMTKTSYVDLDVLSSKTYYYKVIGYRGTAKTATAGPVSASAKFVCQGIDVSEYQGNIEWKKVENDGIDFAMLRIVKGRTGSMSTDARFEEYYKNARAAGLDVGVYRYCYATSVSEVKKEAKKVLAVLDGRKLDYPVVLDMEDNSLITCGISDSTRSKMVLAFKEIIEDAGYDFAMYVNLNWINNYLNMDMLDDVDIWLARWRDYNRGPEYTGKGNLIMWQYSCEGRIDGINGRVDLDVSY